MRSAWPILLLACVALGQPAGRGSIAGEVTEAAGGAPVRKAIVTLTWQGAPKSWATGRTDDSGSFRFEGLPPGKYDLRASKTGLGSAVHGARSVLETGEFISLGAGESRENLILRFIHSGSVGGRVSDADGDPVAGMLVTLLHLTRNLGHPVLAPAARMAKRINCSAPCVRLMWAKHQSMRLSSCGVASISGRPLWKVRLQTHFSSRASTFCSPPSTRQFLRTQPRVRLALMGRSFSNPRFPGRCVYWSLRRPPS
jgi:hypothetical protein